MWVVVHNCSSQSIILFFPLRTIESHTWGYYWPMKMRFKHTVGFCQPANSNRYTTWMKHKEKSLNVFLRVCTSSSKHWLWSKEFNHLSPYRSQSVKETAGNTEWVLQARHKSVIHREWILLEHWDLTLYLEVVAAHSVRPEETSTHLERMI